MKRHRVGSRALLVEQVVDVFVGDLGEGHSKAAPAADASFSTLLMMRAKTSLSSSEAFLTRRRTRPSERALVEDHDQDHALRHDRDVDVVLLALVEVDRELLLADQLARPSVAATLPAVSEASDVVSRFSISPWRRSAGRSCRRGRRPWRWRRLELRDDRLICVELLLVHDDVGRRHSGSSSRMARAPSLSLNTERGEPPGNAIE